MLPAYRLGANVFQQICALARRAAVTYVLSALSIGHVEAQRAEVPATLETRIGALITDLAAALHPMKTSEKTRRASGCHQRVGRESA